MVQGREQEVVQGEYSVSIALYSTSGILPGLERREYATWAPDCSSRYPEL